MAEEEAKKTKTPGYWLRFRAWIKSAPRRLWGWVKFMLRRLWRWVKLMPRRLWGQAKSWPQRIWRWLKQSRVGLYFIIVIWCGAFPTGIIYCDLNDSFKIKEELEEFWINEESAVSPIVSIYGLFALTFGLVLAMFRTRELARENHIAEQGQVTERYTRSVEQLGHGNQAVRVGGLYSLERIAEESRKDRRQIFQILAGFVRARTLIEYETDEKGEIQKDEKGTSIPKPSKQRSEKIDVETAVKILARPVFEEVRGG